MPDPISWSQDLPYFAAGFLVAYLLGSIPFGLLLTKFSGAGDIREIGSGNIGATNVRVPVEKAQGRALFDAAKGYVAVLIGQSFGPDLAIIAAWGAVFGHLFPGVWLKFKGGMAVRPRSALVSALFPYLPFMLAPDVVGGFHRPPLLSLATLPAIAAAPIYAWLLGYHQIAEAFVPIASDLAQASWQYPPPPRR